MIIYTPRFIIGVILLLTNQLFGWSGVILSSYWAKKRKQKLFLVLGISIYALSWCMFLLGSVLAGPQGIMLVKWIFVHYGFYSLAALIVLVIAIVMYIRYRRVKTIRR
jgi:hypothetical protein